MQLFKPNIYAAKLLLLFGLANYSLILSLLVYFLGDDTRLLQLNQFEERENESYTSHNNQPLPIKRQGLTVLILIGPIGTQSMINEF